MMLNQGGINALILHNFNIAATPCKRIDSLKNLWKTQVELSIDAHSVESFDTTGEMILGEEE